MGQQHSFFKTDWKHHLCHGGRLRKKKRGRGVRPLSTKEPLHVVFKINKSKLRYRGLRNPKNFAFTQNLIKKWATYFYIKIEQISIQGDHIHILLRAPKRSQFHHFFRVTAGQIAQRFEKEGLLTNPIAETKVTDTPKDPQKGTKLWKYRPFSRVIRGYKAYLIAKDYIQLNQKEALGEIPYRKTRLRGLSSQDWELLWA